MAKKTPAKRQKRASQGSQYIHKLRQIWDACRQSRLFRYALLWLLAYAVLLTSFFTRVLRDFNYLEVFPKELIFPMLMHATTAAFIAALMFVLRWLRSYTAKMLSVTVLALLMMGYGSGLQEAAGVIRAFTPGLTDADPLPLVSLVYLLLLIAMSVGVGMGYEALQRKFNRLPPQSMRLVLAIFVGFLFVPVALSVTKMAPSLLAQSRVRPPAIASNGPATPQEKPDIYYIVLDRYTNNTVLREQFSFDNSPFTSFLKDNGFHVNEEAYTSYPYTTMSIASTLNGIYTNELVAPFKDKAVQSRTLYHNLIWQSSVIKALKNAGYTYHSIGSNYGASYKAPLAEHEHTWTHHLKIFGFNKYLRGIEALSFSNSPYYPLSQMTTSWWPLKIAVREHADNIRDQIKALQDLSGQQDAGGRFIFAHILVPHDPYIFNADGSFSDNSGNDNAGRLIKDKYLGQVQFINTKMQEIISSAQANSGGEAIIILNSDEGPYPSVLNATFEQPDATVDNLGRGGTGADMTTWPNDYLRMKFGIQQAVHIPNATPSDLAHLSSVNVFRIVLNRYLGYELDYLPQCHFGLIRGDYNQFNYTDITARFVAEKQPYCKAQESLPARQ
jgi:hypothetical protein